ncbi:carboxymuconolactone decarboxylase family protein [Rapidithrix thailandica]|uniref:Carboxymuconolactone decarboxylase family protein n=1 Tax=Rapidithrix thailandica TaxID=413964 RepID=A0AAW9S2X2_9BACT
MEKRIDIQKLEPNAYEAMFGLEKYLSSTGLDKTLALLIEIRASQVNGCAYCLDIHTKNALKNGESQRRIFALSAWWESPLFNDKEKALLQMVDEISLISEKGLSSPTYQKAKEQFTDKEIAQIIMQISTINVWNRIAISTHMVHEE